MKPSVAAVGMAQGQMLCVTPSVAPAFIIIYNDNSLLFIMIIVYYYYDSIIMINYTDGQVLHGGVCSGVLCGLVLRAASAGGGGGGGAPGGGD
jgi:hypothetical protein